MSEFLVLGAGKMGSVLARALLDREPGHRVTLVDRDPAQLERAAALASGDRVASLRVDLRDGPACQEAFRAKDVAIAALPHAYSIMALEMAVRCGVHFVDLVGEDPAARQVHDARATQRGITLLSGIGVAPGISNACVGRAVGLLDQTDTAVIYVGGNPMRPEPPLNYKVVFAIESVLDAYDRTVSILENGRLVQVSPLSGLEPIGFAPPYDEMECFYTDGLHSLLHTMQGRVTGLLAEKTVRYKGHADGIETLKACGLFSQQPLRIDGQEVVPRRLLAHVLESRMQLGEEGDVTLLRVVVKGRKQGKPETHVFEMVDHFDPEKRVTSMARTTAFPAAITAQMITAGTISQRGSVFPETVFAGDLFDPLMAALREYGVVVSHRVIPGG
ncbi:MAG: L-lysine dehydrogenase [Gemmatimonadales bacterium]|nr:L-lysine dehydrogenase [Gemmatimonadales bacterium]NIN50098.1 L-lysine dehydrogenase [Gemmatimonadales bacterium]NIP07562.1 L-lysine dehydrogenase [Gemmatimonadales bacterium]NIR01718.1 L-lysine dehydrogenase [Gemmatimonadales bacterium]NIS65621.1 L-lysine dehydrogenase [Gemmatimonadales bacterium]